MKSATTHTSLRHSCHYVTTTSSSWSCYALAMSRRRIATEYKDVGPYIGHGGGRVGASQPPAIPCNDPILPMDFNPHIEWFEFPKEIFDPKFPYTREESIRMTEESWESTAEEMASRYGMRLNVSTKPTFWMAWALMVLYGWYTLWGCYRALGSEPGWSHFRDVVLSQPNAPVLEEDDIYLDQWMRPELRERFVKHDRFWNWKPLVKREGASTSWSIPMHHPDECEWRHMTSRT